MLDVNHILLESSPHGVSIWNNRHQVVSVNRQLMKLYGAINEREFLAKYNKPFVEYQPNGLPSQDTFTFNLKRAFDGETVRFEWMSQTLQGEQLPLELTMVSYLKEHEFFVAMYTVDLREVKKAMEELREADERAQTLISALPIPSVLVAPAPDYQIIECNQAAVELLALKPREPFEYLESEDFEIYYCSNQCEICGHYQLASCIAKRCLLRNWRHTIKGYKENPDEIADWIKQSCELAQEKGKSVSTNYRKTLMGEEIFVETTLVPAKYRGQQGYAFYMRDLSETKLREVAEEESRAKTRFLARMSHEIRTPMNSILGISEIQLQKSHPPETEDAFSRINHSSHLLISIINDILDLSKVEAGKMEIIPQPYDFSNMLIETVQLNMIHIGGKKIELKLEPDKGIPRFMIGDELRIKQIMNNLLSNAFKYTKRGSVTLSISYEALTEENSVELIIEITDTGQGMSKSQLNTLFELEFNRHNIQANRDVQGSGLGMTITYLLVSLMDGKISVESTPGKGTKFTVRIPQKFEKYEPLGELAEQLQNVDKIRKFLRKIEKIERENLEHGRVLVVDDIESNLYVAEGMLEPYQLTVDTALSGDEALAKVQSGKEYDIIFMDHMMPEMDGIETARRIREEGYTTPIVALTANILAGQEEMFMSNGFNGFVPKPIDANKLDEYLRMFIKNKSVEEKKSAPAPTNISKRLIAAFLRDSEKVSKVLTEIYVSQDYCEKSLNLYTISTHAMKSALANINETALSNIAYTLEEAGRAGDIGKIKAKTGLFLEQLAEVVEKLKPKDSPNARDEDIGFLRKQMQIISENCQVFSKKDARKALAALHDKSWSTKTQQMLDEIASALLHSEFKRAGDIARSFLQ
ncbi:MAG: ATP-binding protein [Defluviitaleaceae bacterium]|nr:ATP-binding protein [Defluviitaleaceae bacterium]